jgi:hypothetical protein
VRRTRPPDRRRGQPTVERVDSAGSFGAPGRQHLSAARIAVLLTTPGGRDANNFDELRDRPHPSKQHVAVRAGTPGRLAVLPGDCWTARHFSASPHNTPRGCRTIRDRTRGSDGIVRPYLSAVIRLHQNVIDWHAAVAALYHQTHPTR